MPRTSRGNDKDRDDLFAATPPLEAKRLLFSRAATRIEGKSRRKLLFIDAKRAHLYPKCEDDVYIELLAEAGGGPEDCGKLSFWSYGFRPAAHAWEHHYSKELEACGFERGDACSVIFYHEERDLSCVVHGDDFTFCGYGDDLKWITKMMESWFEIKVRAVLGDDESDDKEATILGRTVRWKDWGIEYEADHKHRKLLLERFGMDHTSKEVTVNGGLDASGEEEWDFEELQKGEATEFRAAAARLNFLSQDSPDLQYPAKETSREMSRPLRGSWRRMKRVMRFLLGRESVIWSFPWQGEVDCFDVYADSDWGGRVGSRKSTSGGVVMLGKHCIKTWSSTQGAVALSSAEAEFYAMIAGVLRAKGLLSIAKELGFKSFTGVIKIATDSSAAKSFVSRRGLGKMRHLEIRDLWLQKEVIMRWAGFRLESQRTRKPRRSDDEVFEGRIDRR